MAQYGVNWTQYELSFGVYDQDRCTGELRIAPTGCEIGEVREVDRVSCSTSGIYVTASLEIDVFSRQGFDFVSPDCFRELLAFLRRDEDQAPSPFSLLGCEGGLEIHFRWREEGDVHISGQIPRKVPESVYKIWNPDPWALRKRIRTIVEFEFLLDPKLISSNCEIIESMLEQLRELESRPEP